MHLAEIYVLCEDGRSLKQMSNVLAEVNYDTMRHLKKLPSARSRAERESAFRELREELKAAYATYSQLRDVGKLTFDAASRIINLNQKKLNLKKV